MRTPSNLGLMRLTAALAGLLFCLSLAAAGTGLCGEEENCAGDGNEHSGKD